MDLGGTAAARPDGEIGVGTAGDEYRDAQISARQSERLLRGEGIVEIGAAAGTFEIGAAAVTGKNKEGSSAVAVSTILELVGPTVTEELALPHPCAQLWTQDPAFSQRLDPGP